MGFIIRKFILSIFIKTLNYHISINQLIINFIITSDIDCQMPKSITLLSVCLVLALIGLTNSVTWIEFALREAHCSKTTPITKCILNPLSNSTYDKQYEPNDCAVDYFKSMACLTAFSKCT